MVQNAKHYTTAASHYGLHYEIIELKRTHENRLFKPVVERVTIREVEVRNDGEQTDGLSQMEQSVYQDLTKWEIK